MTWKNSKNDTRQLRLCRPFSPKILIRNERSYFATIYLHAKESSRKNQSVVSSLREQPPRKVAQRIRKEAVARNLPVVRRRHLVRDLNDRSSPPPRLRRIFHSPYHPAAVVLPPSLPGSRLFRPELRFERLSSAATLATRFLFPRRRFSPLTSYRLSRPR